MKEYQTFIVRIWADDASDVARGHIQHVRTRRTMYFQDAMRMLRFIDEYLSPLSLSGEVDDTAPAEECSEDASCGPGPLEGRFADEPTDQIVRPNSGVE